MDTANRFLIAVAPNEDNSRVLSYAARILGARPTWQVCLFQRLPAVPPELREHQGAEDPHKERELEKGLKEKHREWHSEAEADTRRSLDRVAAALEAAGVPGASIERHLGEAAEEDRLHDVLLRAARDLRCGTLILGRSSGSRMAELFTRHTSTEVVRKGEGLAVWVIE